MSCLTATISFVESLTGGFRLADENGTYFWPKIKNDDINYHSDGPSNC